MNTFDGWNDELYHHGIKGQKWGFRKYQNPDGTLTEEGKARYGYGGTESAKGRAKFLNKLDQKIAHNLAKMDQAKKAVKYDKYKSYVEKTRDSVKSILNAAERDGMKISQTKTTRVTTTGKSIVKGMLAAGATSVLIGALASGTKVTATNSSGLRTVHYYPGKVPAPIGAIPGMVIGAGITKYKKGIRYKAAKNT